MGRMELKYKRIT